MVQNPTSALSYTSVSGGINFYTDAIYGSEGTPISGAVTINNTAGIAGKRVILYHQDSGIPTFVDGSNTNIIPVGIFRYVINTVNIIEMLWTSSTDIVASITSANYNPRKVMSTRHHLEDDYIDGTDRRFTSQVVATGTNTTENTNAATGGGIFGYAVQTVSAVSDIAAYRTGAASIIFGTNPMQAEFVFRIPVASDATNTFLFKAGFTDGYATAGTDQVAIVYTTAGFAAITRNNSVETATNTAIAGFVANTWFKCKIEVNRAGTQADYWLTTLSAAYSVTPQVSHTANIPTSAGRELAFCHSMGKSVGAGAVVGQVDRAEFNIFE